MEFLKTFAPMVGSALGGPFGGIAASFIAEKLGLEGKTVDVVTKALSDNKMTADQVAAIRLAEIDFTKFLAQNEITLSQLDTQNTADARAMQIAVKSHTPDILAVVIVVGFFGILITMMLGLLIATDQQALLILLGSLSAGFGAVLNFFFGSSRGSQNKDVLLANSTPTK
jgi:uncharacterized membrane protein